MINIKKELEKYKQKEINEDIKSYDEVSVLLHSFNRIVERIGKDQYRSLKHIDDIAETLEDKRALEDLLDEMKDKISSMEKERNSLLEVLMEICDLTENMYTYSKHSQDSNLIDQMELQIKSLRQSLMKCGITSFGNAGDIFDRKLYTAVEVRECMDLPDGQILEVIKSGYIYKGHLLKKAEAVVNHTEYRDK